MDGPAKGTELENTGFLFPGLSWGWKVPAQGKLRLDAGRVSYSITEQPPAKVIKWIERSANRPDLVERLQNWSGPVDVLDVEVAEAKWKISWAYSWTMMVLKAGGVTWRIRFTPGSGYIDAKEVAAGKVGRRWRKALREAG